MRSSKGSTNKYTHATNMGPNVKKANTKELKREENNQNVVSFSAFEGNSVTRARSGRRDASHSLAVVLWGGDLIVSGAEERG